MASLPPGVKIVNERAENGGIAFTLQITDKKLYEQYLRGTKKPKKS